MDTVQRTRKFAHRRTRPTWARNVGKIQGYLSAYPSATNKEIAQALKMPVSTVGRWAKLVREKRGLPAPKGPRSSAGWADVKYHLMALIEALDKVSPKERTENDG